MAGKDTSRSSVVTGVERTAIRANVRPTRSRTQASGDAHAPDKAAGRVKRRERTLCRELALDASTPAGTVRPRPAWRGDREAEGTRLLSGRSSKGYRGFESLPLRKEMYRASFRAGTRR